MNIGVIEMKLEELIYQKIITSGIESKLAMYGAVPAIFYSEVLTDNKERWEKEQYPCICYWVDMQANQERSSAGVLTMSFMCLNVEEQLLKQTEPILKQCMKDSILNPSENDRFYVFSWAKTEKFSWKKQDITKLTDGAFVVGIDIIFDILEYTCQETTSPDPIVALNCYIKEQYPNAIVLGHDMVDEIIKATVDIPIFYNRLQEVSLVQVTNTVVWFQGKISVHLFCHNDSTKMKIMKELIHRVGIDGEVMMTDNSYMLLENFTINYNLDYLKEGQIKIVVKYGVFRYSEEKNKIMSIKMKGGF